MLKPMIYVLTGENDFARLQKKQSVISDFVTQHSDLGLETFSGEESEFNAMQAAVESLPFLASRKLVVLNAPGANKYFLEQCKAMLENVVDTTDVLIDEPKFDKRSSYYKHCKKLDGFQEFAELDAHQLAADADLRIATALALSFLTRLHQLNQRLNCEGF